MLVDIKTTTKSRAIIIKWTTLTNDLDVKKGIETSSCN